MVLWYFVARRNSASQCHWFFLGDVMKNTFYFSHDYNARTDDKIKSLLRTHGMLGYGVFWSIIEDLYNNANALRLDYGGIAYDLRVDENVVKSVINDFELFTVSDQKFSSSSVGKRISERDEKSDKARKSAIFRWSADKQDANALRTQCEGNAIKERKGKERKENILEENIIKESFGEKKSPLKNFDRSNIKSNHEQYLDWGNKCEGKKMSDKYRELVLTLIQNNNLPNKKMENVLSLKFQITYENYEALRNQYEHKDIIEKLYAMESSPKNLKDKQNAFLVLKTWLKKSYER